MIEIYFVEDFNARTVVGYFNNRSEAETVAAPENSKQMPTKRVGVIEVFESASEFAGALNLEDKNEKENNSEMEVEKDGGIRFR